MYGVCAQYGIGGLALFRASGFAVESLVKEKDILRTGREAAGASGHCRNTKIRQSISPKPQGQKKTLGFVSSFPAAF